MTDIGPQFHEDPRRDAHDIWQLVAVICHLQSATCPNAVRCDDRGPLHPPRLFVCQVTCNTDRRDLMDKTLDHQLINTFGWDPGHQNGLHHLLLHQTTLRRDSTMTELTTLRRDAMSTELTIRVPIPPLNPSDSMRDQHDEDNDTLDRQSIDTCCWDPGCLNGPTSGSCTRRPYAGT
jgi:hypothetical protein